MRKQPLVKLSAELQAVVDREEAIIRWVAGRHPSDRRWWHELPEYKRNLWRLRYDDEVWRMRYSTEPRKRLTPAWVVEARARNHYEENKRLAEAWAADLRQAWLDNKPCPITPAPRYAHVLTWAFELATLTPQHFRTLNPQLSTND